MAALTPILPLLHPSVRKNTGAVAFGPPAADKAKQGPGHRFHLPTLSTKIAPTAAAVTAQQRI